MDSLKQKALEHITSLEKINSALIVVRIKGWIVLSFFLFILVVVMGWGFFGSIPLVAKGRAVLFNAKTTMRLRSPVVGVVKKVVETGGAQVNEGDPLIIMQDEAGEEVILRAPIDGSVVWVDAIVGGGISKGQPLLTVQGIPSVDGLEIYAFLPLNLGELVRVGMPTKCALDKVDPSRYGLLRGVVKEVLPYPIDTSEYYLQRLPSPRLREYLLSGPAPYLLIVITPVLNPDTVSGLEWTSKDGPPHMIFLPELGAVRVILGEERPLSYILP